MWRFATYKYPLQTSLLVSSSYHVKKNYKEPIDKHTIRFVMLTECYSYKMPTGS